MSCIGYSNMLISEHATLNEYAIHWWMSSTLKLWDLLKNMRKCIRSFNIHTGLPFAKGIKENLKETI